MSNLPMRPDHPADSGHQATYQHQGDEIGIERQFNYEQGVSKLKKEFSDVMDSTGQAFPNDPHYKETQDAVSTMADSIKVKR